MEYVAENKAKHDAAHKDEGPKVPSKDLALDLAAAKNKLQVMEEELEQSKKNQEDLLTSYENLEQVMVDNSERISQLEQENEDLKQQVSAYMIEESVRNSQIQQLTGENEQLKRENAYRISESELLKHKVAELERGNIVVREQNNWMSYEKAKMQADITLIKEENMRLHQEMARVYEEYARMKKCLEEVNTKGQPVNANTVSTDIPFHEIAFLHLIGAGGFGEVYKGRWKGQKVAVKRIKHVYEKQTLSPLIHESLTTM